MKEGLSLQDLAAKLDRIREAKADFIVDTRALTVSPTGEGNQLVADIAGSEEFVIRPHALRQMEQRVKIDARYADRLQEKYPDMLAYNLNELFKREPEKRLIRTLNGSMRAFLSDGYRIMDNFDLAEAVLPTLIEHGAQVISCEVTEAKMHIKAIRPDLTAKFGPPPGKEMGVGHNFFIEEVQAGLTIANSEIGAGKMYVQPSVFTNRCTNWASFEDSSYARVHLGKRASGDSEAMIWEVMSDDTKRKSDEALWAQVRDMAVAAMDGRLFEKIVDRLKEARGDTIKGDPVKLIQRVGEQYALTEGEQGGILNLLIQGGDLTRYGLHAAITRAANDIESYDRATEFEHFGAQVIDLPQNDWQRLAA